MISILLDHETSAPGLRSLNTFQGLLVYSLWQLVSYYCVKIV